MATLSKIENPNYVPVMIFERAQARMERSNRRLWILIIILVVLLFASNIGWIIWENSWEYIPSSTISQEVNSDDGGNAYIQDSGNITYGTR